MEGTMSMSELLARQIKYRKWCDANADTEAFRSMKRCLAKLKWQNASQEMQWQFIMDVIGREDESSAPEPTPDPSLALPDVADCGLPDPTERRWPMPPLRPPPLLVSVPQQGAPTEVTQHMPAVFPPCVPGSDEEKVNAEFDAMFGSCNFALPAEEPAGDVALDSFDDLLSNFPQ